MSEMWKYIIFADKKGKEYPLVFHKALSHKDMAEGGLVAGISGWSKTAGRCTPISAGFIAMPSFQVDERMQSESLGIGPRVGLDQLQFTGP